MGEISDIDSSKDSHQIKYIRDDIPEVVIPVYKGEKILPSSLTPWTFRRELAWRSMA